MDQTVSTKSIEWQDLFKDKDADTIFQLAYQHGWEGVEEFGFGKMIADTMEVNGWILKPWSSYTGIVPEEGLAILEKIEESVELAGVVIADDKRKVKPDFTKNDRVILSSDQIKKILIVGAATFALPIAAIAAAMLLPILVGLGMLLLLPLAALGYDPAIICVTKEGTWICVYRW